MLDKVLSNKLERLRTYDVKFRIPEEKLIDLRTVRSPVPAVS
jgi:hypothetical protein